MATEYPTGYVERSPQEFADAIEEKAKELNRLVSDAHRQHAMTVRWSVDDGKLRPGVWMQIIPGKVQE